MCACALALDKQEPLLSSLSAVLRSFLWGCLEWLPKIYKPEHLNTLDNPSPTTAIFMVPGSWGERYVWRGGTGYAIPQKPKWPSILTAEPALPIPAQAPNKADETYSWNPREPAHPGSPQPVGRCAGILELLVELLSADQIGGTGTWLSLQSRWF